MNSYIKTDIVQFIAKCINAPIVPINNNSVNEYGLPNNTLTFKTTNDQLI